MSLNKSNNVDKNKREKQHTFPFYFFKHPSTWMFYGLCIVNFLYGCTAVINGIKWYRFFPFILLIFAHLIGFRKKGIIGNLLLSVLFCFHTIHAYNIPYFLPLTSSFLAFILYILSPLHRDLRSSLSFAIHGFIIGLAGMTLYIFAPESIHWISFPFAINIWFLWVGTVLLIKSSRNLVPPESSL